MILSQLKKQLSKKQVHSIQSLSKELNLPKKEIINALELLKIFDGLNNVKIDGELLNIDPPCMNDNPKFNCKRCSTSFCLLKAKTLSKSHQN